MYGKIEVVNDGSQKSKDVLNYLRERRIEHDVMGGDSFCISLNDGGIIVFHSSEISLIVSLIDLYANPDPEPIQPFA